MNFLLWARLKHIAASLLALVLLFYLMGHLGGCANLTPGYRAAYAVRQAGDATAAGMNIVLKKAHADCLKKCANSTPCPAYVKCIAPYFKAGDRFQKFVVPALNSALSATWGGLETARAAKEKADWQTLIKPGLCALVEFLGQWKYLIKGKAAEILGQLHSLGRVVCP